MIEIFGGRLPIFPGTLIVPEGIDGSGKGTQVRMLAKAISERFPDRQVVTTMEPWDVPHSPDGMRIRRILKHQETEIDPGDGKILSDKFQKLYVCDRYMHWLLFLAPALAEGAIVICDRERMSTYAYGAAFMYPGSFQGNLEKLHSWHEFLPVPNKIIQLEVPPKEAARRLVNRAKEKGEELEFFETEEKLIKIARAYTGVLQSGLLPMAVEVDGVGTEDEVHERVLKQALSVIQ